MEEEETGNATAATVVDTPRRHSPPSPRASSTTRLGHFQLLEPLGSGGMGTVYSAYDLRLDRKVAIKVLSETSAGQEDDQQRQRRMLREAQVMAKLSHPNVVPVYEVGVDEDTLFIAMEYIAGQTLGDWLEDKPPWREIVDVFIQAGRGLLAAHEVGIVLTATSSRRTFSSMHSVTFASLISGSHRCEAWRWRTSPRACPTSMWSEVAS